MRSVTMELPGTRIAQYRCRPDNPLIDAAAKEYGPKERSSGDTADLKVCTTSTRLLRCRGLGEVGRGDRDVCLHVAQLDGRSPIEPRRGDAERQLHAADG